MGKNFINFTNHPRKLWEESQIIAAEEYGDIIDLPFPMVEPEVDEETISNLASKCVDSILKFSPAAVLCQGEFTLCFAVVQMLREKGIRTLAACSKRSVREYGNRKVSEFHFVQFREYSNSQESIASKIQSKS